MTTGTDIVEFALTWKNEDGAVICNCIGQDLGSEGSGSHNVRIIKVTSCRVSSNREPAPVNAQSSVLSAMVQGQIVSIIGKSFGINEDVMRHGLLQYIVPPA
jgi:hypothetical protein